MTKRSMKIFWLCELNLILWMSSLGFVLMFHLDGTGNTELIKAAWLPSIAGSILAALTQHWAYHNIYKPIKEEKKRKTEQGGGEERR